MQKNVIVIDANVLVRMFFSYIPFQFLIPFANIRMVQTIPSAVRTAHIPAR